MRIQVRLPKIQPNEYELPKQCPYDGCSGDAFKPHGRKGEAKAVRDTDHDKVTSYRYKCATCGYTFRIYPAGVSQAQQSNRLKAMSVLLYILGISYGGVADFLWSFGLQMSKTTVYDNVQAAGVVARKRQKATVKHGGQRAIIGADGTFLKVKGVQVGIEVVVDDETGELLGLDITASESTEEIEPFIREIAEQVKAEVLVSDDFNSYKNIADNADLAHQICQSHIIRNVDKVVESIGRPTRMLHPPLMPKGVKSSYHQIERDCRILQGLVRDRPPDAKQILAILYDCYKATLTPRPKQKHSIWYRMKRLIWRLWMRWERITLHDHFEQLDGTNNACERLIGWWIKERYRTMRGYKRTLSIRNVVAVTSLLGAAAEPYDMGLLYA
ncbi:MAG: transposase [Anaerolinea sp.]|nr:transposase [Anaerolinea sp.]